VVAEAGLGFRRGVAKDQQVSRTQFTTGNLVPYATVALFAALPID
jgi:hypothetical protein